MENKAEIYFAGGCFWGIEKYFRQITGVTHTDVGYANGNIDNPNYEQVCSGKTNCVETVHLVYDPDKITLLKLLEFYYKAIEPVSKNKQGNDEGSQYRTGIYYTNQEDEDVINESISNLQKQYDKDIAIEVKPIENYHKAEQYHQNYLEKNPDGYCHIKEGLFKYIEEQNKENENKLKKN